MRTGELACGPRRVQQNNFLCRDLDFDRPIGQGQQHIARQVDITLADNSNLHFNLDDPMYDFDLGPADGIGSQDFDLDIGVDFGDGEATKSRKGKSKAAQEEDEEDGMSVEVGRGASMGPRAGRPSFDSALNRGAGGADDLDAFAEGSRHGMDDFGMGEGFGADMAMDLDLGISFGDDEAQRAEQS